MSEIHSCREGLPDVLVKRGLVFFVLSRQSVGRDDENCRLVHVFVRLVQSITDVGSLPFEQQFCGWQYKFAQGRGGIELLAGDDLRFKFRSVLFANRQIHLVPADFHRGKYLSHETDELRLASVAQACEPQHMLLRLDP